jgi:hypothetical protein
MKYILALLALVLAIPTFATLPAAAQTEEVIIYGPHGVPQYMGWQPAWDRFEYDRHHVILGTVAAFAPYRLQIARRDGNIQMIDLKNGTVILPTGATPAQNQRVAIVGYYSHGTFIANRVVLHY